MNRETLIHNIVTSGGAAPNIVPAYVAAWYYIRQPSSVQLILRKVLPGIPGRKLPKGFTNIDDRYDMNQILDSLR